MVSNSLELGCRDDREEEQMQRRSRYYGAENNIKHSASPSFSFLHRPPASNYLAMDTSKPIAFSEHLQLSSLGIQPASISFQVRF